MNIMWEREEERTMVGKDWIAIYSLCDPNTGEIRYVGQTWNPKQRLRAHLSLRDGRSNPWKARWISGLLKQQQEPEMHVILVVPKAEADETEMMAIRVIWQDHHLLNRVLPAELYSVKT